MGQPEVGRTRHMSGFKIGLAVVGRVVQIMNVCQGSICLQCTCDSPTTKNIHGYL